MSATKLYHMTLPLKRHGAREHDLRLFRVVTFRQIISLSDRGFGRFRGLRRLGGLRNIILVLNRGDIR